MPSPGSQRRRTPAALRYAGLGLQLAATLVIGVWLGSWLDQRAGTGALFTMLGAFLGFGGTLYSLIRQLSAADKDDQ